MPPPLMMGFAPFPQEPRRIGADAEPLPTATNEPVHAVPAFNSTASPAANAPRAGFAAATEFHGAFCVPLPSVEAEQST